MDFALVKPHDAEPLGVTANSGDIPPADVRHWAETYVSTGSAPEQLNPTTTLHVDW